MKQDIPRRTSSIVAVKNGKNPDCYLVYEDTGWGMRLFPNFATAAEDENNIVRKLSEQLEVEPEKIHLSFKTDGHEIKFSTEHQQDREYFYRFYCAEIDSFPYQDDDSFEIAVRKYDWMTVDEMLNDPKIRKYNGYVVGRVRDNS